jgi:hypothetical protein
VRRERCAEREERAEYKFCSLRKEKERGEDRTGQREKEEGVRLKKRI